MESKEYIISRIDGEYAYLEDLVSGEELFIAMALLPVEVEVGTKLAYQFPDFTVIE